MTAPVKVNSSAKAKRELCEKTLHPPEERNPLKKPPQNPGMPSNSCTIVYIFFSR